VTARTITRRLTIGGFVTIDWQSRAQWYSGACIDARIARLSLAYHRSLFNMEDRGMADRLLSSLKTLARQRQVIKEKERQVEQVERRFLENLGRLLTPLGYRLIPVNGRATKSGRSLGASSTPSPLIKRLRCPHCDRRFARPLHLGRHLSAAHSKKASAPAKKQRAAKK
jgi:hypothetical protein